MARTITVRDETEIRIASQQLGEIQKRLRRAGATRARQAVARARKSVDGALRHAHRMAFRAANP